ncbi:MAG: alpha/beta hydrolase [Pseudomonadota bacterium]
MAVRSETIGSDTGASLRAYVGDTDQSPPRAVVQINHGLAEHAARYGRFQDALAAAGFASVAHDHRGHGATNAPDSMPRVYAHKSGADKVLTDIEHVHGFARGRWPEVPVVTFGHSAGGLMALNFACKNPEASAALAVWNSNASGGVAGRLAQVILAVEARLNGGSTASKIIPKLTFDAWNRQLAPNRTDFDWLSRDDAEVDAYIADPLCGWSASVSMWRDIFRLIYGAGDTRNLSNLPSALPIHLLGGGADPATNGAKATKAMAGKLAHVGCRNISLNTLPETRHESLNETNRDETMAAFIAWLQDHFPVRQPA